MRLARAAGRFASARGPASGTLGVVSAPWWPFVVAFAKRGAAAAAAGLAARAAPAKAPPPAPAIEEPAVSYAVEAALLAKVAPYDTAFAARAGDGVEIGILTRAGDIGSNAAGEALQAELGRVGSIGGLPHEEVILPYNNAAALVTACRVRRVAILIVTPGFGPDLDAVRAAVDGIDLLTVAVAPSDVARGMVLGFDVVDGKPRMLLNREQALRHNVKLRSDVLRVMKLAP